MQIARQLARLVCWWRGHDWWLSLGRSTRLAGGLRVRAYRREYCRRCLTKQPTTPNQFIDCTFEVGPGGIATGNGDGIRMV